VALYAMLMAVASNQQSAMMAPTELLAEQHHASIARVLARSKVRVELLTGSTPTLERESILSRAASGEIDILIGTHSLLTSSVRFASLAVAVIDEQHRFGVSQRAAMRSKSDDATLTPHVIVMTATPIPRTLAITLFGDLDISTISELPPGRQAITTRVVGSEKRDEVYAWVRTRLDTGEQAYIVAPAIEPTGTRAAPTLEDDDDADRMTRDETPDKPLPPLLDVRTLAERLESKEFTGKRVAVLHGRLRRSTREAIMERFRAGQIDALVATTVIEVGVDVPNASVMVVENAERFGLAQLHQLRGRVGRGSTKSACILIADAITEESRARLDAIASTPIRSAALPRCRSLTRSRSAQAGAARCRRVDRPFSAPRRSGRSPLA
jgi:ATP-dependent DNA helicase RecG